jgi:hypothetical protein
VMSYSDIVEAQAKQDAKEAAAQEQKRGAKRKCGQPNKYLCKEYGKVKWKSLKTRSKQWDLESTVLS